jgi:hypothetical protein
MKHGIRGVETLTPERRLVRGDQTEVTFRLPDGRRHTAVVRRIEEGPSLLTCTATEPAPRRRFELVSLVSA